MRWGWNEICPPEALLTGPGAVSWSGQGFPRTARQPRSWGGAGWSPPPRGPQGQGSVPTVSLRLAAPAWEAELTRLDGGEGGGSRRLVNPDTGPSPFCLCELSHLQRPVVAPNNLCGDDHPTLQMRKLRSTVTHMPEPRPGPEPGAVVGLVPGTRLGILGRGRLTRADRPRERRPGSWCPQNPAALGLLGLPHTWLLGYREGPSVGPQVGTDGLRKAWGSPAGSASGALGNGLFLMSWGWGLSRRPTNVPLAPRHSKPSDWIPGHP